jgi:hypothetical protein
VLGFSFLKINFQDPAIVRLVMYPCEISQYLGLDQLVP